jgi:hypothetical protein
MKIEIQLSPAVQAEKIAAFSNHWTAIPQGESCLSPRGGKRERALSWPKGEARERANSSFGMVEPSFFGMEESWPNQQERESKPRGESTSKEGES